MLTLSHFQGMAEPSTFSHRALQDPSDPALDRGYRFGLRAPLVHPLEPLITRNRYKTFMAKIPLVTGIANLLITRSYCALCKVLRLNVQQRQDFD